MAGIKKSREYGAPPKETTFLEPEEMELIQAYFETDDSLFLLLKYVVFILLSFLACRLEQLVGGAISAGCYPVWPGQMYFGRKIKERFFLVNVVFDKTNINGTVD